MSPRKGRILIVDDELAILEACEEALSYHGYDVQARAVPDDGIQLARERTFDIVLLDLKMPDKDGLQVLQELKSIDANLRIVMITAFPTISTAIEAMKEGAFDYLPKPFSPDQLILTVDRALSQKRLTEENVMLRRALRVRPGFDGIIARSSAMERVMDLVERLAEGDSSVLIEGETGTGKELIARSLHANSLRHSGPFLPIDCGALPEHLLESELFGHERGAFTGAHTRKPGLFEVAKGGTVFLDEIPTLGVDLQVKLLRVLQERVLRRVGGTESIDVDIRLISATNERLEDAIAAGRFRQDLYYRLNVVSVSLPPLRERREDIPLLADYFVQQFNERGHKTIDGISTEALNMLESYDWPGNVRELQNAIEGAFSLTDSGQLTSAALPAPLTAGEVADASPHLSSFADAKRDFERLFVLETLERCKGNVSNAAAEAGLHRSSFQRLMRRHGIRSDSHRP